LRAHPQPAEVAIVVNQLTNLIGGAGHLYNRGALSRSLSGYYRMFTERNTRVDFMKRNSPAPVPCARARYF
jgi:hypothetical protein